MLWFQAHIGHPLPPSHYLSTIAFIGAQARNFHSDTSLVTTEPLKNISTKCLENDLSNALPDQKFTKTKMYFDSTE